MENFSRKGDEKKGIGEKKGEKRMRVVAQMQAGYFVDDRPYPMSRMKWRKLDGKPFIWHVVERLKGSKKIDDVILYLQETEENKEVISLCRKWNLSFRIVGKPWHDWRTQISWYKGLEAEIVIVLGIMVSCLVDPKDLDMIITHFISKDLDYLETPGKEIRIIKTNVLERIYKLERNNKLARDWVSFIKERKDVFRSDVFGELRDLRLLGKDSTEKNLKKWIPLLGKIYGKFYRHPEIVNLEEVLSFHEREPDWFEFLPGSQLEIEVTNDCSLKCIMCPRTSKMLREVGYMNFDLFKKIIKNMYASSIHFSGLGEPLLHPQIREMFTYAKEEGFEVGLWTNGLNLSEDFSKEIVEKELVDYIIFGLDAATQETYAKVRGVDVYDKVVENITRFLELKKEKAAKMEKDSLGWWERVKPIVGVQILKMKETDLEIEEFMNKWDWMDKVKKMINYRNRSQEVSKLENEGEKQQASRKLSEELWKTFYTKAKLPVEHAIIGHFDRYCNQIEDKSVIDVTPLKRFTCRQLSSSPTILWNGDAVVCRHDINGEYILGNLRKQDMKDITKKIEDLWQAHRDGKYDNLPLCGNCKEWYYDLYA